MQSRKEKNGYWLMLSRGEEIKSTISEWARGKKIRGAQVWGIGAINEVEAAYFDPGAKKWKTMRFPEKSYELLSCIGNINEDGLHAHITFSSSGFRIFGGHLNSAKISVFGEFFVLPTSPLNKTMAPKVGLKGITLEK